MHASLRSHPALLHAVQYLERIKNTQFELYFLKKNSTQIDCKNQEVEFFSQSEDSGISIRVLQNGKLGFSYTTALDNHSVEKAIDSALQVLPYMPKLHSKASGFQFQSFSLSHFPAYEAYDETGVHTSLAKKIELAKNLENQAYQIDQRISGIRKASYSENIFETHLVDSQGEHLEFKNSIFSLSVNLKASQNSDHQTGGGLSFSHELGLLDSSEVVTEAVQNATEILCATLPSSMRIPAVLKNSVVYQLLNFISSSFSAEEVFKGRSLLANKEGERIFSDCISIIDDGLYTSGKNTGYGSSPFDGEGIPSRKTTLVNNGFLDGFLYDTFYAKVFNQESTGNSSRGIKTPPIISPTNLYIQAGKNSPDALIKGIQKGVYLTQLMGVHTANSVTGDFSLGANGILIENGVLTQPIKGFAVSGNVLDLFREAVEVGSDLKFFGTIGAPAMFVPEIQVSGKN